MTITEVKILESVIVLVIFALVKFISNVTIKKATEKFKYQKSRIKVVKKILNVILVLSIVALFLIVWGVDQSKLLLFLSSFLTILGVAFFAQWSILSNVTSTLILFFNHHVKISDNIAVAEKDSQIEGKISDIGFFFVKIKTKDNEEILIPSNLFIQKAIKRNLNP
tara:strand:+ start:280 stop:777 length:498 start_codon:yes stop_codon:yes gene_type:complete